MTTPGFAADTDAIREHAGTVDTAAGDLRYALAAAAYLTAADDGYGLLVQPYARSVLGDLHERVETALRSVADSAARLPGALTSAASAIERGETVSAESLEGAGR